MAARIQFFWWLVALPSVAALAQSPARFANVGVIDIQSVLARTREGQRATADLSAKAAPQQRELSGKENELNALREQLRAGAASLSEDSKRALSSEIDQKTQILRREVQTAQAEWNQERQKAFQQLGKRVMEVINRYAREQGFVLVLDASPPQTPVLYSEKTIDITKAIIELCDRESPAENAASPTRTAAPAPSAGGHPDLQGTWTNSTMTLLERPLGLSWTLSDQEATKYEKAVIADRSNDRRDGPPEVDVGRAYNDLFFDQGNALTRVGDSVRTALIVDPPDGHRPPFTMDANRRIAAANAYSQEHPADRAQDRTLAERCLLWGAGPPMMPLPYNSNFQIVQTPDYVAIMVEMMHDVRTIPLDGRPHLPSDVRQWMGDSRGHWEGDTLVVETTNFTDKTAFQGTGENLRVTERFRRLDADTILYRFTIDDPDTFIRPWTAELPFTKASGPVYEFACHEGNYALRNILMGARAEEERADEAAKKR
jgi:Skp family chaperone for outer membrane proteins